MLIPPVLNLFIVLHFIPFFLIISEVPFVADKEKPCLSNLCATPIISCLWEFLTDKKRISDISIAGLKFLDPANAVVVGVQMARTAVLDEEEEEESEDGGEGTEGATDGGEKTPETAESAE